MTGMRVSRTGRGPTRAGHRSRPLLRAGIVPVTARPSPRAGGSRSDDERVTQAHTFTDDADEHANPAAAFSRLAGSPITATTTTG